MSVSDFVASGTKVALITGGGYGLGAAIASKLGQLGYKIGIVGRSDDKLREQAASLQQQGISCKWHHCDVTDWNAVVNTLQFIESAHGPVTVLVNNAGGWQGETVEEADPLRLRALVEATVLGTVFFSKAVVPTMKRQGGGFILNIGSTSGLASTRDTAVASTPKAAVRLFTHIFAREVARYGIRVAVLHPARISKKLSAPEAEGRNSEGLYKSLSPRQVADIASFILEQPVNVLIRELVVTPLNVDL